VSFGLRSLTLSDAFDIEAFRWSVMDRERSVGGIDPWQCCRDVDGDGME
jgi:hypothetical protein